MIGRIAFREVRGASKILLIFCIATFIYSAGAIALFPAYRASMVEQLEGAENVHLELPSDPQGNITLTWDPLENATSYVVLEYNASSIFNAKTKYMGDATSITFQKDFIEKRYYAVMAVLEGAPDLVLIGIATTESGDPFSQLLANPLYRSFTGGRSVSMTELKGFITLEFFFVWALLAAMVIAYTSVAMVAGDFENRYLDILLSKPISRRRYLTEKFIAITTFSTILAMTAAIGLIIGASAINSTSELSAQAALLSLVGALPVFMIVAAVGILSSVATHKVRVGMGISFAFVFAQVFMRTFGSISKDLELLKTATIFEYWDYTSVIFDNVFKVVDFIGLTLVALFIFVASILILQRKDIPT
jgi:ABC-2 type transport system permease protein